MKIIHLKTKDKMSVVDNLFAYFGRQYKASINLIGTDKYKFNFNTFSSFLYETNPGNFFVDGNITIKNDNDDLYLLVRFNYWKVILPSLLTGTFASIFFYFLVGRIFKRTIPIIFLIYLTTFGVILAISQIAFLIYKISLISNSLEKLESQITVVRFSRNVLYLYILVFILIIVSGVLVGVYTITYF